MCGNLGQRTGWGRGPPRSEITRRKNWITTKSGRLGIWNQSSERGSYVPLTKAIEHANSPMRHLDKLSCAVIAYGDLETCEFQRLSREFAEAAQARGMLDKLLAAEAYNHFEMLETFADPYGIVGYEFLGKMKLTV
jgi:hypothetical protein